MRGDKILATMFQLFMAAIIIYTLYVHMKTIFVVGAFNNR